MKFLSRGPSSQIVPTLFLLERSSFVSNSGSRGPRWSQSCSGLRVVADLCLEDPACSHLPGLLPPHLYALACGPWFCYLCGLMGKAGSMNQEPRPSWQRALSVPLTTLSPCSWQGMGYLHAKGILHKDLKSKNVFYDNGKVVITDFGLFSISGVLQAGR